MADQGVAQELREALADPRFAVVQKIDGIYLLARKQP